MMPTLRVLLVGSAGYLILIALARNILRNPNLTANSFAIAVSVGLAAVHTLVVIAGAGWGPDLVVVILILAIGPFIISYPAATYIFHWYRRITKG